jgi:Lipocalin-like domain
MRRSISSFGTYSLNEEKKTVILYIVSSTYPNFAGEAKERTTDKLTADEFINTNPNVAGAVARQISIRRRRETQRGLARRAPYIASYDGLFRLFVDKRDARLALFSSACLYDA